MKDQKKDFPDTKDYFKVSEVFTYFFRKKDPNRKTNINIKVMHGINRLAILMFLVAIIVLLIRHVF